MNGRHKCPDQLVRENVTLIYARANGGGIGKVSGAT